MSTDLQRVHLIMSSQPEEVANSCDDPEEMSDSDDLCQEALDRFERQRAFQTQLLEQSGGGMDTNAEGAFEFELERFVDRRSQRLGVREHHFNTQLRQRGDLIPGQNITQALQDGLR